MAGTMAQATIYIILAITMGLFIWNRWRYDLVAGLALLAAVYSGVVPMDHAFDGFSHPAVITVASVLVISQALQASGVVSLFLRYMAISRKRLTTQLLTNCGVTALLSAFMNNIGALALMLPVSIRDARKAKRASSQLLMPLSFASLLGGLVTLIGTPPNIVIASFRAEQTGEPFAMFDFTPVGLVVAVTGIVFMTFCARYLLPSRADGSGSDRFGIASYVTELRVPEGSELIGRTVGYLEQYCDNEASVVGLVRQGRRRLAPHTEELLYVNDILIVQGPSEPLQPLFENVAMLEVGAAETAINWQNSARVKTIEAVVMPNATIIGTAARELGIHDRFGINLLALARDGMAARSRLKLLRFKAGDVLLLQGVAGELDQACQTLGCLPIKNRGLNITPRRGTLIAPVTFGAGVAATATGLVPVHIAFPTVVIALVLMNVISLRDAYRSVEWPVIVLLGCLVPVGHALQSTGATETIGAALSQSASGLPLWGIVALIMVISMTLADLVHNTPTAVLMAPIAYAIAAHTAQPPDALLMAVAIGAASPYLTPIGHQSNTLVMGPGNYRFGDYWRLGLPLDILILVTAVPMIVWVWG